MGKAMFWLWVVCVVGLLAAAIYKVAVCSWDEIGRFFISCGIGGVFSYLIRISGEYYRSRFQNKGEGA